MNKTLTKLKILLGIAKNKFGKVETETAEIFYDCDTLAVETRVYDAEGNAIPDGEYKDENNIYVIKESVVTEIRPAEKVEEEKTETTTTTETETTEEKTEEMAEEEVVEETTETTETTETETVAEPEGPAIEERVKALEEIVESLYEEIRQMKVREVESVAKNEEIIREFSAMRSKPSAESVTRGGSGESNTFACDDERKADKLKALKNKN